MPRYWRSVLVAPAIVRRIRKAAELTQAALAAELSLTERTVERWERDGAVLERVSSLSTTYNATRYGKLEAIARRGELELELDVDGTRNDVVVRIRKRRTRHFSQDLKKRPRKTRQATRSRPGLGRGMGGKRGKAG